MEKIEEILNYTKKNKCDLHSHLLHISNLLRTHNIKSVFTNNSEQGHIANFVKFLDGNISLNSQSDDCEMFGDYENCNYINKQLETIKIQDYEMMQLDCSQEFNDWDLYTARIIRLNPKFVILCNTKKNIQNSKIILKALTRKPYNIDTTFDDYYGMIILKYRSK